MTREIGVGVIGMGWMGETHSRAYRQVLERFTDAEFAPRLVVCSDNVESRARDAQRRLGFELYTTNWPEVISNPEVEVVNITVPNGLHLEIVRAAAAAMSSSRRSVAV